PSAPGTGPACGAGKRRPYINRTRQGLMLMRGILEKYGTAIAGLVLVGFFALAAPNFAAPGNLLNIVKETSFLAILAIGFTLALVTAELDLSVADVASLAAV